MSRSIDRYEDWAMVFAGLIAALVVISIGVTAFVSANGRDVRLGDAAVTQQRLTIGGADDDLDYRLITLQLDETKLFEAQVDTPVPGSSADGDPQVDLRMVEADAATVDRQLGGSTHVRSDTDLILRELPIYADLEATAQADNRLGLPLGAAYLRDASEYLRADILPRADDIRAMDQARLVADDAAMTGQPLVPVVVDALGLAFLVALQIALARRTRRTLNAGVLLATALVAALAAWSITDTFVSRNQFATRAVPHARAAADLVKTRSDALRAQLDDQLWLADPSEDCSATSTSLAQNSHDFTVICAFEQDALRYLNRADGHIPIDLVTSLHDTPDATSRLLIGQAQELAADWFDKETSLPSLENIAAMAGPRAVLAAGRGVARYSADFDQSVLGDYAQVDATLTLVATASETYSDFAQQDVRDAVSEEWTDYHDAVLTSRRTLNGVADAALLIGLLAGAAVVAGVGARVAEYWSARRPEV